MDTAEDQDSLVFPDGLASEPQVHEPEPEPFEALEPPAKRLRSSEESTEKGPTGQPQARVQPQTQMTAPKQTQTPDQLPEPPEALVVPRIQPQVLQIQTLSKLQKQAQTQTSPEHLAPQQNQVQPQVSTQAQPQEQTSEKTQDQPQTWPQGQHPHQNKHQFRPVPRNHSYYLTLQKLGETQRRPCQNQ